MTFSLVEAGVIKAVTNPLRGWFFCLAFVSIGLESNFKELARQMEGGKPMLLGISKRGDAYLRTLLIHGARSVIRIAERKTGDAQDWLIQLIGRRHKNIATVALDNKNARIVWALLAQDRNYQSDYVPLAA